MSETVDITLSKVVWHGVGKFNKSGTKYLIARTSAGLTIKGEMEKPIQDEKYRLWGEHKLQKPYQGRPAEMAFEFSTHEVLIDQSESGIAHYLKTYVDGLGYVKANALVNEFGVETLTVLRIDPEKALTVKGITAEIIESIRSHFAEAKFDPVAYAALIDLFSGMRIPKRIVTTLVKDFGSDAPQIVKAKPYILLAFPRLGWKTVDSFAISQAIGYPADGIERHKWAIIEVLERISSQGHTYGGKVDIESIAYPLIDARPREEAWEVALAENLICVEDLGDEATPVYCLPKIAQAERTIARRITTLLETATPLGFPLPAEGLNDEQAAALAIVEDHGVSCVVGPPGVGKTYTLTKTIAGLVANGIRSIRFVAPTGKAAKRGAELIARALPDSGIECTTIHRALEPMPSKEEAGIPQESAKLGRGREEFGFARNAANPIESQIIVADEQSMTDVKLGASLLSAVANGTRLILVGDPNQLPSVGPGSMLRDLIAGGVPTGGLSEPQRNSGRIVRACHSILKGEVPEPAKRLDLDAGDNWVHIEKLDSAAIADTIVSLHETARKNGRFDPFWDMQVISPEKKKPGIGCENLNQLLSDLLNPYKQANPHGLSSDDRGARPEFERGDKIIRTKNGLCDLMTPESEVDDEDCTWTRWDGDRYGLTETDIVNGDMGTILDITTERDNWYVVVKFINPDRVCRLPYGDCHLSPAYAVTCHKAQGSGFPYVIVPVHNSFYFNARTGEGLWNREMIYTLFSRAEKLLVTVGDFSAIRAAVGRKTVERRRTRLKSLIAGMLATEHTAQETGVFADVEA